MIYKRITLLCGHYGSGKTNVAVNMAYDQKAKYDRVAIADLDIVNPYFRTKDSAEDFKAQGIELICSEYAGSNVDIPAMPQQMYSLTDDKDQMAIIDVGGESLEETITAVVDPVIKKSILGGEDIKVEDLITGAYEDAIGALGPSLIFMGLGKPVLISQINTAETNTINTIRGANYLTNEQKADMIKKIQDISADARWGVNENYNEIYDTDMNNRESEEFTLQSILFAKSNLPDPNLRCVCDYCESIGNPKCCGFHSRNCKSNDTYQQKQDSED